MSAATLEKMKKMKLYGMFRMFKTSLESIRREDLTPDEMAAALVDSEWDDRQNRSFERSVKNARFRYKASIESMNFEEQRNIDKNLIMRLAACEFIDKHENVLITGSTGVGKSFIASALGHQACSLGYRVNYFSTARLFGKLKMAKVPMFKIDAESPEYFGSSDGTFYYKFKETLHEQDTERVRSFASKRNETVHGN